MVFPQMLFQVDDTTKVFEANITRDKLRRGVFPLNVSGHTPLMDPDITLATWNFAFS